MSTNPLEMSDEEFMDKFTAMDNSTVTTDEIIPKPQSSVESNQENVEDLSNEENTSEEENETNQEPNEELENNINTNSDDENNNKESVNNTEEVITEDVKEVENNTSKEEDKDSNKSDWNEVAKPFKANGKDIQVDNPQDAIKLMQMGANYTKKMQQLQPRLKIVKMLENNGLLDEDKLSYLIDLNNKNPEAIQKLVKEAGIDPLDIDTSKENSYIPKNHSVSDNEMAFNNVLEDVLITDTGKETVKFISDNWDEHSKNALFREPEVLRYINEQRASGVYDAISSEIERQKMLGNLPINIPFVEAYGRVGQMLQNQKNNNTPVARRAPVTRAPVNEDINNRAKAASPSKSTPTVKDTREVNYLDLPDDEFTQKYGNKI